MGQLRCAGLAKRSGPLWRGAAGALIRVKREGKVTSLRVELERLRDLEGFWLGDAVYREALRAAGEEAVGGE